MTSQNSLKFYSEIYSEESDIEPYMNIYQSPISQFIQPGDPESNYHPISEQSKDIENISEVDIEDEIENSFKQDSQSKKSTQKVNSKNKTPKNDYESYKKKDSIVVVGEKIKQKSKTKNLPKFFINSILNNMESVCLSSPAKASLIKKKVKKFKKKSSSLITLQEMLKDQDIKQITKDYICSFDFLDQILTSERLQDVLPPIQFINKLYQGCFDSNILNDWKDPNSDF